MPSTMIFSMLMAVACRPAARPFKPMPAAPLQVQVSSGGSGKVTERPPSKGNCCNLGASRHFTKAFDKGQWGEHQQYGATELQMRHAQFQGA